MAPAARDSVQRLVRGTVVGSQNCPDGFSPGLACRLRLGDGRRVFVKAIDGEAWPNEMDAYRAEAWIAQHLPDGAPAPRHLGSYDDGRWVILAFEDIDGQPPTCPWTHDQLEMVIGALDFGRLPDVALPADHPRLGGWAEISDVERLRDRSPWAAEHLAALIELERDGRSAATGDTLVHFDPYAHNILLTPRGPVFVDWPHARLGAPFVDLIILLSSVAVDGVDPEPYIGSGHQIDAVLAAHAGFCLKGGLSTPAPGLEPIAAVKLAIGLAATDWLRRRIS